MADKLYMTIREACNATGLSMLYLRNGCKSGSIPHIMCGNRFMINMQKLLEQLNAESEGAQYEQRN